MEASEYHWSKGSEGEEAGDEGRETGSGQLLRAWEALSKTLEFTLSMTYTFLWRKGVRALVVLEYGLHFQPIYLVAECTMNDVSTLKQGDHSGGAFSSSSCKRGWYLAFGGSNTAGRRGLYEMCGHRHVA